MMPLSTDKDFFTSRPFNRVGTPLVWTEKRSKLTPITLTAASQLVGLYAISVKLDGKFIRVIKKGYMIRMLTSGSLDFYHNRLAMEMSEFPDGQYNMEVIYHYGNLGDLYQTGYITTAVTDYKHQRPECGYWTGAGDGLRFVVHDYIPLNKDGAGYKLSTDFNTRRTVINRLYLPEHTDRESLLSAIHTTYVNPSLRYRSAEQMIKELHYSLKYDPTKHEGLVFQNTVSHYQLPVNLTSYKVKNHKECAGCVVASERNVDGGHGTLIVQVDGIPYGKAGSVCRVSSGINDEIRGMSDKQVCQLRVEVDYEQVTEAGEYTHPRIKRYFKNGQ